MTNTNRDPYLSVDGALLLTAEGYVPPFKSGVEQKVGLYGILSDDLKDLWTRGMGTQIAQLYELVIPGLILSRHIFTGLRRKLYADDSGDGDKCKLVFTRLPAFDVTINRGGVGTTPSVVKVQCPKDKVFVVVISPNIKHQEKYPMIAGWLDRWNWVPQDNGLAEAPIRWLERYDEKSFTRG